MATYNLYDAKNSLSELVERAERGEEIVIARRNVPAVKLVPVVESERTLRVPGRWRGVFTVPDAFFDPLPDDEMEGL